MRLTTYELLTLAAAAELRERRRQRWAQTATGQGSIPNDNTNHMA